MGPHQLDLFHVPDVEASSRAHLLSTVVTLGLTGLMVFGISALAQRSWLSEVAASAFQQARITGSEPAIEPPRTSLVETPPVQHVEAPVVPVLATPRARSTAPDPMRPPTAPIDGRGQYGIGDRIKINFFEKIELEEDKWGRGGSALKTIQNRPELSGEFSVQEDGTITVPLIGTIPVADLSLAQVQSSLAAAFEDLIGRKGIVSLSISDRQPIYVIGPVKNPGSYKYVPNMTVLHAVALSGGLDTGSGDPWQKIEAVRAIQKRSGAADAMLKLLARLAVLKAERDGARPSPPVKLIEMVGMAEARGILLEQADKRRAAAIARHNRELSIKSALESARQDAKLVANRIGPIDDLIKLRQERVSAVTQLIDRNVLAKSSLSQVQAELSEADQRRFEAIGQYTQVKQRLQSLESESNRLISDMQSELETDIEMTDRQIAEQQRDYTVSEGVLSTLPVSRARLAAARDASRNVFRVVRHTANGPIEMKASGMTVLQPGDLVNIVTASEADGPIEPVEPLAPVPAGTLPAEPDADVTTETPPKRLNVSIDRRAMGGSPPVASELR